MSLFLVICIISVFFYICYRLTFPKNHEIVSKFPGPKPLPVVGNLIPKNITAMTKQLISWYGCYKSPMVIKIGPKYWIHIYKADHVEAALKDLRNIKKGFTYGFIEAWLGKGLLTSTGEKWHRNRKLLTPTFHYKILNDFLVIMNEQSKILVDQINKRLQSATNTEIIDICPFITLCALDTICETSMGKELHSQTAMEMSPYVKGLLDFTEIVTYRVLHSWAWNDFFFFNFTQMGKRLKKSLNVMHTFTKQVIKQRRNNRIDVGVVVDEFGRKTRLAFLDLLLEMERNGQLKENEVQEEVDTFMFEGHDTTATGIMWACYCLGRHRQVQRQVQVEIDEILGEEKGACPTPDQLHQMKHLERCVKESQRMYAPVPFVERTIEFPLKIDDQYTIPPGCTVGLNIHQLHYDPNYFPEPTKWDPDRFLPDNAEGRHPFAFCPFSGGLRNCIGQKFAMMEEKVMLCHLLRNFTFEAVQEPETMDPTYQFVLRPVNGVQLKITKR